MGRLLLSSGESQMWLYEAKKKLIKKTKKTGSNFRKVRIFLAGEKWLFNVRIEPQKSKFVCDFPEG